MNNSSTKKHWLTWPVFYELTELYTAFLNIFWFALATAITQFIWGHVNWQNVLLCFIDIFIFNLAANSADDYYDYLHALDRKDYAKKINIIGRKNLPLNGVRAFFWGLFVLSAIPGFFLVQNTNWKVLILGIIGYALGIFYTAGPHPINSTPISSLVSTFTISYYIQLIVIYVSVFKFVPLTWGFAGEVFLLCLPQTLIFFLMQLGNDCCDKEVDERNHRFTLAHYIGKKNSITLIKCAVILGPIWSVVNVLLHIAPPITALSVLTLPIIWHGLQPFFKNPDKKKTFMLVFKYMSIFFFTYTLTFMLGAWVPALH